ncbi:MAG TPA: hypothetical protein DCL54_11690, partial [Alphaproteobacteria bacterium]|nr:hypothetical protein [Alphaproteobacteria bacterium]
AYDSYRRFIQMFSNVVLDVDHDHFEEILSLFKEDNGFELDTEIDAAGWREIVSRFKAKVADETEQPFPQDPAAQLWGAIGA